MKSPDYLPPRFAVSLAAGLVFVSCIAQAQTAEAPAKPADKDEVVVQERVVVTAQKRPQFAEKVPMSLSAVPREQLEKQGVGDFTDLGRLSPGLSANTANTLGQPDIAIRGVSSQSGAATTAIYVDDAPIQTRALGTMLGGTAFPELFDIDHVEVLRGPQGTLFGSSSQGGAIRFITPVPRSTETNGLIRVGLGMTQGGAPSHNAGLAMGGSLDGTDAALYRFSIAERHEGGYIDRVDRSTGAVVERNTNGRDAEVLRATLQWRPITALTITPAIFVQQSKDGDHNVYYEEAGPFKTYNKLRQPTHDGFTLGSVSVAYEAEDFTLKSVTSYFDRKQRRTDDFSYADGASYLGQEVVPGLEDYVSRNDMVTGQRNLTQEFRIASNGDESSPTNWVAGVYLSRAHLSASQITTEDIDRFSRIALGGPAVVVFGSAPIGPQGQYSYVEDDRLQDRTVAVFGEYSRKLGAHTTVTAGLRLGHNQYDLYSQQDGPFAPNGSTTVLGQQKDRSVLPKLSLSHELSTDDMVYATAASGDRPGGGNPQLGGYLSCKQDLADLGQTDVPTSFKADKLWSYEAGYKGRMLDRSVEFATSMYYIDWRDIQTRITLPTCQFSFIANAGRARSTGADVQLQWRAPRAFSVSASASVTDARYTQTVYGNGMPSGTGAPIVRSGQSLPVAKVNATLGAEYAWAPAAGRRAFVRADYQYAGSYKRTGSEGAFDYDAGVYNAVATHFVTLNAGWTAGPYQWSATLLNAFNSRAELLRTHYSVSDPDYQAITFRPRTLTVNLAYKF